MYTASRVRWMVLGCVLLALVFVMGTVGLARSAGSSERSEAAESPPPAAVVLAGYDPNELSYGLYWYGDGNDTSQSQKAEPGVPNPYFDPEKPTLIFAHGWQPYISNNQPDFDFNGTDTAEAWINAGWNVGVFVWNQFSDETTGVTLGGVWFSGSAPQGVKDAEAKIWTTNGPRGMRWRDWNSLTGYNEPPAGTSSAAELFYNAYVDAMPITYTGNIRIAGHSLGNQMAVRFTKLVNDGVVAEEIPETLRPHRVVLLDPYWSPDPRTYLDGKTTGQVVREYITELLPTGTLFEWYHSSDWTTPPEGDANDALKTLTLYAEMSPDYVTSGLDKHMAAQHLYFWSYAFDGPAACTGGDCVSMTKLLAKMTDAQLADVMRSDYVWTQIGGGDNPTPEDDIYRSGRLPNTPYKIETFQAQPESQSAGRPITVTATVNADNGTLVGDGILVNFATDFGTISPRSATRAGVASAIIMASNAGPARVTATTLGARGSTQQTLVVTFTEAVSQCTPVTDTAIVGPLDITGSVYVNTGYDFQAVITPTGSTDPISYTWSPEPSAGQGTDKVRYTWTTTGTQTITLTVEHCGGTLVVTREVYVAARETECVPLQDVGIEGPVGSPGTLIIGTDYTFNAVITPTDATPVITYTWTPTPTNGQNTATARYRWADAGVYTITVTAENCGGVVGPAQRVLDIGKRRVYLPLVLRVSGS